ncbi:MAG: hypothetical protein H0X65_05750 [Gemmatimonadetes bacterium]|nr:hypothetical protein [Gemmatimonadota bacterium]
MKRAVLLFTSAALLAACTDRQHPTGVDPDIAAGKAAPVPAAASQSTLPSPLLPVEDALVRLLVSLPEVPAKGDLRAALADLAAGIETGDAAAIRTSRRAAEDALKLLGRRVPAEFEADLDVVKLAVESVEEPDGGTPQPKPGGSRK